MLVDVLSVMWSNCCSSKPAQHLAGAAATLKDTESVNVVHFSDSSSARIYLKCTCAFLNSCRGLHTIQLICERTLKKVFASAAQDEAQLVAGALAGPQGWHLPLRGAAAALAAEGRAPRRAPAHPPCRSPARISTLRRPSRNSRRRRAPPQSYQPFTSPAAFLSSGMQFLEGHSRRLMRLPKGVLRKWVSRCFLCVMRSLPHRRGCCIFWKMRSHLQTCRSGWHPEFCCT